MTMISARKAQQESLFTIYRYFYINTAQLEALAIRTAKIHVTPVYVGHSTRH